MKKETMEQLDVFSRHINGGKGPLAEALEGVARMQKISLLPYAEEDDFNRMEKYMLSHGPRLADTFLQSAKICITPELEKVLINLRGFEFIRHPKYNLPEWRLKALEEQMQH